MSTKPHQIPIKTQILKINLAMHRSDIKDINHKQDFRNGTFVTHKRKYLSKPLQSESNWTNQIACFDQPMESDQSDCLFCSHFEHSG